MFLFLESGKTTVWMFKTSQTTSWHVTGTKKPRGPDCPWGITGRGPELTFDPCILHEPTHSEEELFLPKSYEWNQNTFAKASMWVSTLKNLRAKGARSYTGTEVAMATSTKPCFYYPVPPQPAGDTLLRWGPWLTTFAQLWWGLSHSPALRAHGWTVLPWWLV